jgi:hypothetical protein
MKTAFGNQYEAYHAVVLIPHWMRERLVARQVGLNSLLLFKRATELFSVNDLAGLLALQTKMHYLTGGIPSLSLPDNQGDCNISPTQSGNASVYYTLSNSRFNTPADIVENWEKSIPAGSTDDFDTLKVVVTLSQSEEVKKEIDARLFSSGVEITERIISGIREDAIDTNNCVFETVSADAFLTYVIIRPGSFTTQYMEKNPNRLNFLETILRSFYRTMEAHHVSRTVWFESYVKTLNEIR